MQKRDEDMNTNEITSKIIEASINVHKELGPGLFESVYQRCLVIELMEMGMTVEYEIALPIRYRGHEIHDEGFRIDLMVERNVIVELKSTEQIKPIHKKQLLTYLRMANKSLGLLINFNVCMLCDGISRIINPDYN
jgi:GxxExxY protein